MVTRIALIWSARATMLVLAPKKEIDVCAHAMTWTAQDAWAC